MGKHSAPRRSRRGVSLLEVMFSICVLTIGLSGFLQTIVKTSSLESTNDEQATATAAARAVIESMRAETFDEVFARYNDSQADDPVGGVSPGGSFAVAGLRLRDDDDDGMAGRILFPVGAGAPTVLREDLINAQLATPLDLDADGDVEATDCSANYRLLPVVVRVEWLSRGGPATFEIRTILGNTP